MKLQFESKRKGCAEEEADGGRVEEVQGKETCLRTVVRRSVQYDVYGKHWGRLGDSGNIIVTGISTIEKNLHRKEAFCKSFLVWVKVQYDHFLCKWIYGMETAPNN